VSSDADPNTNVAGPEDGRVLRGARNRRVIVEALLELIREGDEVLAKCIDIDPAGRIRLSRKEALADIAAMEAAKAGAGAGESAEDDD